METISNIASSVYTAVIGSDTSTTPESTSKPEASPTKPIGYRNTTTSEASMRKEDGMNDTIGKTTIE